MTIVGEPGIGKSRLAAELREIAGDGARVLTGRCPAYGEGITYWPLREIVLQARASARVDELAADAGARAGRGAQRGGGGRPRGGRAG